MVDLISVIVPVFNVERYLDRCIQSIARQTYSNIEIILVDDGSQDTCASMCDDWIKKDCRIKVVHKANGGLSEARNVGMSLAKGEYISFVDSDDWIAPEMYELLLHALKRDDSDIAACAVKMIWEDGKTSRLMTVQNNYVLSRVQAQDALLRETLLKQPVWYKLYRRDIVIDIPFEVGKYHEDVFWSYRAIGNARRVSIIDYIGYYYTQRNGSIMNTRYSLKRLDVLEAIEKRYIYLSEQFPSLECRARLSILSGCIYHGQMADRFLEKEERLLAFKRLEEIKNRYTFTHQDYKDRKMVHRIWFDFGRISLPFVCRLKNLFHVNL